MYSTDVTERKKVEEALRASEENLRNILDSSPDAITVTNLEGKILECNKRTLDLHGFSTKQELIGRSAFDLIAPKNQKRAAKNREKTLKDGFIRNVEYTLLTKDANEFPAEFSASVIRDSSGRPTCFVAITKDITERKKAQEALKESEEKYRLVVENANEAILVAQDGKHKFVNPKMVEVTGYSEEELMSGPFLGFIHPDDREMVVDRYQRRLEGEELPHVYPLRIVDKSGNTKWVQINAAKFNWNGRSVTLSLLVDITERKKAEEALKNSAREWHATFDAIGDAVFLTDLKGKILRCNEAMAKFLGKSFREIVGRTCWELVHGTSKPPEGCPVLYMQKSHRREMMVLPVDERYFDITADPLLDQEGNLIGAVHIMADITERKRAEETLIQSERLRALGEMAGGVAHDFNNLLAIILGNAQLLERGAGRYKEEEIKERLKVIARTAHEGGETVRRLQYFTRREASVEEYTELNLNEIVRSAISSTSPRWKNEKEKEGVSIKIREELKDELLIRGSRPEIMEVLTNLIFNSVEAMGERGEISIRTEAKNSKVYLYFQDTGEGISKRVQNRVFDPFFTTKGPKASGLGLSVSYGIMKRHRGDIKVESKKGKGSTFTLSFPSEAKVPQKRRKPEKIKKAFSKKILIIDDEEGVRDILGRILEGGSHRVVLKGTSREALDKFKEDNSDLTLSGLEDKFDLVLTDLGMPDMSGWELAKEVKKIDKDIPVGLITGWGLGGRYHQREDEGGGSRFYSIQTL